MKKNLLQFLIIISATLTVNGQRLKYPVTEKIKVIDTFHEIQVIDNYRWLENTKSLKVKDWVKKQNKIAKKYLNRIINSNGSIKKMKELYWYQMNYDSYKQHKKNYDYYYRLMFAGRNSPLTIYYTKGNKTSFEKLVGPKSISKKDQINFTRLRPSYDNRFLAYQYNRNGSDWEEIKIVGIKKRRFFKETIKEVVNPQINWYRQGFFYIKNKYNKDKISRAFPEVMYHKLGTPQSADEKILNVSTKNEKLNLYGTENQSIYIIKKSDKFKKKFSYYYLKPNDSTKKFNSLFKNISYDMDIVRFKSDTVTAITRIKNKKYLITFPIKQQKKWALLSPSYKDAVFTDYEFAEDKIVTSFQTDNASLITVSNSKGKVLGEVITPNGLSVSGLYYDTEKKELTFKLSSYTVPPVTCQLDLNAYTFKYLGKTQVSFDATKYKFMRKKFTSHDGKKVPMFIVYKDSLPKNGKTPFLLKTYGGYGSIAKPSFDPGVIYFIENGGAFAYVHIRGGGEFGYDWWQEGRNLNKKNGIVDFTKGAEFLIKEGYTQPKKIGIIGTSHGGLIAAAAMIQSPEYFGAAVINVGALDMLRMENTEAGAYYVNINEFGSVTKKNEFYNLHSYSPFHTLKEGINYPSTLLITGSNDSRVPPHQSYKFAGKMQNNTFQENPVLLWTQDKAGHYGANKYNRIFEEQSYIYSFLINELNK